MFFFKNIRVGARTYATVKAENFVFIGKYANLLPVITYQISLRYVKRFRKYLLISIFSSKLNTLYFGNESFLDHSLSLIFRAELHP